MAMYDAAKKVVHAAAICASPAAVAAVTTDILFDASTLVATCAGQKGRRCRCWYVFAFFAHMATKTTLLL